MSIEVGTGGGIARVVLDAPPLNILTQALLADLRAVLIERAADPTLRVLVLSARGKHFSAGASVEEHLPGVVETMIPEFMQTILALESFPAPVVVAVHGRCLGGAMELALAGDIVIAAEGALFGTPEIRLGVLPPAACVQLPRLVPAGLAAELIFTGRSIDAEAARAGGLVSRVVSTDALDGEVTRLAESIAANSAAALRSAKKALKAGAGRTDERMAAVSRVYLDELMRTRDATEGLRSFTEKRQPEWSHS
jgi:cyclohexa-1,5-dienecarbonyl-CoA hydratase